MSRRIGLMSVAYLVPTFALGFVWHLVVFEEYYDALGMYREDVIVPFGLLAMGVQAVLFSWAFDGAFTRISTLARRGLWFTAFGGLLSWSFTTIAVAAKNVMTSVPDYLLIESAFTVVQWAIVGPLMASVHAAAESRRAPWGRPANKDAT